MKRYILILILFLFIIQSKLVVSDSIYNCKAFTSFYCWPDKLGCCFPEYGSNGDCWFWDTNCYPLCPCSPPLISIQSPLNTTYETSSIWANVTLNKEGSWCGRSLDNDVNITMTNSSGKWNNLMTSVINDVHNVTLCCNDTNDNMNCSAIEYFTVDKTDNEPPSYTYANDSSGGSATVGTIVSINTLWYDNKGLNSIYFIHNETGSWISDACTLTKPQWCNFTIDTAGKEGSTICWFQKATDVSGNSVSMENEMRCFSVTSSVSVSPGSSQPESPLESVSKSISSSTSEFSMKFITLTFQFFGIVILAILLIVIVEELVRSGA